MTIKDAHAALVDSLATAYPGQASDYTRRPGAVTAVVHLAGLEYEHVTMCDPLPATATATVTVIAAQSGAQAGVDLVGHLAAVEALIAEAGWTPTGCQSDEVGDMPAYEFTATTNTTG